MYVRTPREAIQPLCVTRFTQKPTDWQCQGLARLQQRLRLEQWPGGPLLDHELAVLRLQRMAPLMKDRAWFATDAAGEIVAAAHAGVQPGIARPALFLYVLPEARGRGLGRDLLSAVAEYAHQRRIEALDATTTASVPSGGRLAERIGGVRRNTLIIHMLSRPQCNWNMDEPDARRREHGISLRVVGGRYDDADLLAIVRLKRLVADVYGRSDFPADDQVAATRQRYIETAIASAGIKRWTVLAVRDQSAETVGFSEVVWDPGDPGLLTHTDAAVLEPYRGWGLMRGFTRQLFLDVLAKEPSIGYVRTVAQGSPAGGRPVHDCEQVWRIPAGNLAASSSSEG